MIAQELIDAFSRCAQPCSQPDYILVDAAAYDYWREMVLYPVRIRAYRYLARHGNDRVSRFAFARIHELNRMWH